MKLRITAALLAVVTVFGLSACQTKAGAAALVGGTRISESDVNGYLTAQATPAPAANGGGEIVPRPYVLQTLIRERLLTKTLSANGIQVNDAELANAKQAVLQGGSENDLSSSLDKFGFAPSFEPVYLRSVALLELLSSKIGAKSDADILAAIDKAHVSVTVNPRFGTWDPKTLSLGTVQPPDFLRLDNSLVPST